MDNQDFGKDYLAFYPAHNGLTVDGLQSDKSQVCIDGWLTAEQLRNIAAELDRLEAGMKDKDNG